MTHFDKTVDYLQDKDFLTRNERANILAFASVKTFENDDQWKTWIVELIREEICLTESKKENSYAPVSRMRS